MERPHLEAMPVAELHQRMHWVSRRDLQLWLLALLVLLVTVAGIVALVLPNLSWNSANLRVESRYLPQVLFGLIGIVILFNLYVLQQRRELDQARQAILKQLLEKEREETATMMDPLTQVFNRRYLELILPKEVNRTKRARSALTLLLADVTDLAAINRKCGDATGNRCLVEAAQVLEATFRLSDTVVRYAADQFLVVMPDTSEAQAELALARLERALAERNQKREAPYELVLGCGLATYREGADIHDVVRIAEHSLRAQKVKMRNAKARREELRPLCLLVCSDAAVLGVVQPSLESLGVSLELCTRAEECLELLEHRKFDAVMVDAGEAEDRLELLGRIRQLPAGRRTLLACVVEAARQETAYRLGANLVLTQPLSPDLVKGSLRVAYALMVGEQQRYFRHAVELPVRLRHGKGMEMQVTTTSMSEGGMVVRSSMPMEAGRSVNLRFQPPGVAQPIEGTGDVAWTDLEGRAGIRLLHMPAPARYALERWLAEVTQEGKSQGAEVKSMPAAAKPAAKQKIPA